MASLVNISTKPQQAKAVVADDHRDAEGGQVGVFVTAQSLITFPVATAAVTTIWRVLSTVAPSLGGNKKVPLLIAMLIGALIYMMSVTNAATFKEKFAGAGIALINSFTIAAAAIGIG